MDNLVLNGTEIRSDEFGRYCLTDIYRASNLPAHKRPVKFEATPTFKGVQDVLKVRTGTFNPYEKTRGRYNGGTWACKEMLIAYAMWVSPEFMVKVIDVFFAASSGHGDKAVAIAQGNEELKALVEKRDNLIYIASTQSERDEIERLTSEISKHVRPSAQNLQMMRGKGKKYAEYELSRINASLQLDMFSGSLQ